MTCPEREERAALSDEEFWERVLLRRGPGEPDDEPEPDPLLEELDWGGQPCTECGAYTACSWDSEGRALYHIPRPEEES